MHVDPLNLRHPITACTCATKTDDEGGALQPELATCGTCGFDWCDRCYPCPSGRTPCEDSPKHRAIDLGAEHGHAAGTWVFDGNTDTATLRAFLEMNEEGDPAIWDALPGAPLSGEWADSYSLAQLAADIELSEDADGFDEACTAYEDAWHDAMIGEAVRYARIVTSHDHDTEAR